MKLKKLSQTGMPWLIVAFLVFILDIASKFAVMRSMELYDSIRIMPHFSLTYVRNYGAAFSLFWQQRTFLIVIAAVIALFIVFTLYRNSNKDKVNSLAFSLVLGGALGNVFDRLYHGFVVDFFDVVILGWHYPTFNVADISICCGAALLILKELFWKKAKQTK